MITRRAHDDRIWIRCAARIYRAGGLWYPASFRTRFGQDLCDAFVDDVRVAYRRRGLRALPAILSRSIAEPFRHGVLERLDRTIPGKPSTRARPRRPVLSPDARQAMDTLLHDIRFAARTLRRSAGFTLIVTLTLALGIGAVTTVYTAVNAIVLRPLPLPRAGELEALWYVDPSDVGSRGAVGPVNVEDWRARNAAFTAIGTWQGWRATLSGVETPLSLNGARVSGDYLAVLETVPVHGRIFGPDDDVLGAPNRVLLGYRLWRDQFGADPDLVGGHVRLNDADWEVIGILPPDFRMPLRSETEVVSTLRLDLARYGRGSFFLNAIARRRPGISHEQAAADMDRIAASLAAEYPEFNAGLGIQVEPLLDATVRNVRSQLLVLFGSVAFVLMVTVANVANLLVARASARREEMAVRSALGAGNGRIARQLLTESMLLAAIGGTLGLMLARWGVSALVALAPSGVPRLDEVALDWRIAGFAAGVSALSGIVFGLAPALQGRRLQLTDSLRSRHAGGGASGQRVRRALVAVQVGMALTLLIGAGLMVNSFARLLAEDPGIDPEGILAARVGLGSNYATSALQADFFARAIERLSAHPAVVDAAGVFLMPFAGGSVSGSITLVGRPESESGDEPGSYVQAVTPGYFELLRNPLIAGRTFNAADNPAAERVAVVNETAAERLWPGDNPIGRQLRLHVTLDDQEPDTDRTIVGIVGDTRQWGLDTAPEPFVFVPHSQYPTRSMYLLVRPRGAPTSFVPELRATLAQLDPDLAPYRIDPLTAFVDRSVATERFAMVLLTGFALVALLLGCAGIYGLIAYNVARRTAEIGVRMALGATTASVRRLVLRETAALAAIGLAIGVVASLLLGRFLAAVLYEVSPSDPLTITSTTLLLGAMALLAGLLPARAAARIDPVRALRTS